MFLMDVNVLVYAHREDTPNHLAYREWLESIINGKAAYGYSELVLSGFLRVVTHPRVFEMPSALSNAVHFANQIRDAHSAVCLAPGLMHWNFFCNAWNRSTLKAMIFLMRIMRPWRWNGIVSG